MDFTSPTMTMKKSATPYGITNERKLLMKILVCGARDYGDVELIHEILNRYRIDNPDSLSIIEGGASGADLIASVWANRYHVPCVTVYTDWGRFGKSAGPIRNQQMIDMKPDVVLAFPSGTSRGTYDTINRATHAHILTYVYPPRS